ncbi:hypothetical protein NQ318_014773 [Aromia moschata]|uniref:Angiotensin-converting enzyme n=1 Tax=Aromia moschata TaxID=1265417 RepID=A0AAV8ZDW1_9CUCU|nr:hypothetical protein NQ318_014773 [Aromia moschata]
MNGIIRSYRKIMLKLILLGLCCYGVIQCKDPKIEEEELEAHHFLAAINKKTGENEHKVALANWAYASNLTEENLRNQLAVAAQVAKEEKEIWQQVARYDWGRFSDYNLRRQISKYSILGPSALPEDKFKKLLKIISDMSAIYSKTKICDLHDPKKCDLALEPELTQILANSRDPEELQHVWLQWRNSIGPKCRSLYKDYVSLNNEAARLNNFADTAEYWLHDYEDPNIRQEIQNLWEQLKPLYLQLHAYVRHKLRQKYGDIVSEKGPIPVHLLGNMWGQTWSNVVDFSLPYPGVEGEDLTKELVKENYTAIRIFQTAEEFFKSINLTEMPESFWERSILSKPKDRELICHASAWDFFDQKDYRSAFVYRIKQCTEVTQEQFITAHHEMGHIEYFIQYKDQPVKFRAGANDGFHEAVGDLIALSVRSTKHLRKIGLLKSKNDNLQSVLNNMFETGLDKIAFLPFAYLMDLWRWDVFSGKTKPEDYNCKWWELRERYQGVEPPIDRSEEDFDPAAKYHIVSDVPYLRYFISFVVQFQFHRAVCEKAGEYEANNANKPLHECDIYQNTDAGNALKHGLKKENEKNGAYIGWEASKRVCVRTRKELESKKDD